MPPSAELSTATPPTIIPPANKRLRHPPSTTITISPSPCPTTAPPLVSIFPSSPQRHKLPPPSFLLSSPTPSPSSPTPSPQQPVLSSASRRPTTTIAFLQLLPPPTPAEPPPSATLLSHLPPLQPLVSPPHSPSPLFLLPPYSTTAPPLHLLPFPSRFPLLISFFILSTHRSNSPILPSPQTTTAASSPPTTALY